MLNTTKEEIVTTIITGIVIISLIITGTIIKINNVHGKVELLQQENDRLISEIAYYKEQNEELQALTNSLFDINEHLQSTIKETKICVNELPEKELDSKMITTDYILRSGKWEINETVPLPPLPTDFKACTDYRCYNIEGTPHNRMQQACYTDELGCRRFNTDYCVALGSFYSDRIGDRFEITLDTGVTFNVITADMKADAHTDANNMYHPCVNYNGENAANVLEFIVDTDILSKKAYLYGSLDYYDYFKGNIIKMVYLGRDTLEDWDVYE